MNYGSGSFSGKYLRCRVTKNFSSNGIVGKEYIDKVTLTPDLIIDKQSIGVASKSSGFDGIDGILGFVQSQGHLGRVRITHIVRKQHWASRPYSRDTIARVLGLHTNPDRQSLQRWHHFSQQHCYFICTYYSAIDHQRGNFMG